MFYTGDYFEARLAGEKAAALLPNDPVAVGNYASALRESGSTIEAIPVFRRACALDPLQRVNRSNLLFSLLYDETIGAEELRREATDWARTLARTPVEAPALRASEGERIRIGILSNDLRRHACAYFLIPLIANLDRTRFEVHLFSLSNVNDNITKKIRVYAEGFHDLYKMSEAEVVKAVRAQRCDVMVDLGGYTGASPLTYMVHRLAPKQLTWLGYPGTTGMEQIEYRVTDWTADPEGFDHNYTEKLLRAPVFSAYHPIVTNPLKIYDPQFRVQPTPALNNGYITFGSCNTIAKLGPKTMRLWSAVLARCPNARMLVEATGCDRDNVREMLYERMAAHGIDTSRVELINRDGAAQYVTYNRIDIALDTAPVTGGTTTCDAIWMGVPVVTFSGDTFHQRVSAPFLHAAGLDDLICDTEERYVDVACALADGRAAAQRDPHVDPSACGAERDVRRAALRHLVRGPADRDLQRDQADSRPHRTAPLRPVLRRRVVSRRGPGDVGGRSHPPEGMGAAAQRAREPDLHLVPQLGGGLRPGRIQVPQRRGRRGHRPAGGSHRHAPVRAAAVPQAGALARRTRTGQVRARPAAGRAVRPGAGSAGSLAAAYRVRGDRYRGGHAGGARSRRRGGGSMKAVILAGGLGTRISEESHLRPKPMIEIGGKPILWHIMKMYSAHGVNEFVICLGYKGYVIKEYFANYFLHMSDVTFDMRENRMAVHHRKAEPWSVTLVDTGEDSMTGGRLRRVRDYLTPGEPFCFTYGDGVADVDITRRDRLPPRARHAAPP